MLYLGLDVHCKWFTLAGFDPATGETVRLAKVPNTPEAIAEAFAGLPAPRQGAMEAGTHTLALHRVLAPYFTALLVVAPHRVWDRRRDPRPKTDARDALGLAERLAKGELHGIYLPDDGVRDLRALVRGKLQVTQDLTRLVNQVYALVRAWGVRVEKKALTQAGRAALGAVELPVQATQVLQAQLARLDTLRTLERTLEAEIAAQAAADPICRRLMTIPSVGPFTALVLRVEIGDIRRFRSGDALINYTGLVPHVYQSGERVRYGVLTKAGNPLLRYVAVLFAQNILKNRQDTPFKRRYYRLCHTHGVNEAKIMIARDLLAVVHSMWSRATDWQWPRPTTSRADASVA
jgi:transposase